jgi:hypothetical protein
MASSSGNVKRVILLPSVARIAADAALLSDWVDVDEFTELMVWFDVTAFAARADETIDITIERQADNTAGYTTIATFTQKASTGASSEEETVTSLIGGKIRARAVIAGTWSSKSITFSVKMMAKFA